ncbi:MAG TPA: hypothetical protein VG125_30595 [Pirellulales bacterium]|jgi:hypothetical protein|nr:hypothetical protein [Pirellulales bacterium]
MRWPAAIFLAAVCAVGCHSTPSQLDPFLPNRRIPPPATGAASGTPDAYYTSPAPPYTGAPAYQAPPAGATGGANGSYIPPGGYAPPGSPTPAPVSGGFGAVPSAGRGSVGATPAQSQVTRASYATTADQEPSAVYQRRRASPATSANQAPSSQSIDIMDLPPVLASR